MPYTRLVTYGDITEIYQYEKEQEAKQKAFAEARGAMQQTAPIVPTAPVQPVEAQPTP